MKNTGLSHERPLKACRCIRDDHIFMIFQSVLSRTNIDILKPQCVELHRGNVNVSQHIVLQSEKSVNIMKPQDY